MDNSSKKILRSYPVKLKVKKNNVPDSVENHTLSIMTLVFLTKKRHWFQKHNRAGTGGSIT